MIFKLKLGLVSLYLGQFNSKSNIQYEFWNLEIKSFHLAPRFLGLNALLMEKSPPKDSTKVLSSPLQHTHCNTISSCKCHKGNSKNQYQQTKTATSQLESNESHIKNDVVRPRNALEKRPIKFLRKQGRYNLNCNSGPMLFKVVSGTFFQVFTRTFLGRTTSFVIRL